MKKIKAKAINNFSCKEYGKVKKGQKDLSFSQEAFDEYEKQGFIRGKKSKEDATNPEDRNDGDHGGYDVQSQHQTNHTETSDNEEENGGTGDETGEEKEEEKSDEKHTDETPAKKVVKPHAPKSGNHRGGSNRRGGKR